jgi:putative transposase
MGSVGRRYVRYFNGKHGRTGTLWEGRYRATLIESERYLLTCYRYIELNPVRAGLARHPVEYPWSSHAANAVGTRDPLVSPHPRYLQLAGDPPARRAAYQTLFNSAIDPATLDAIRDATNKEWALGSEDFRREVAVRLNRRAAPLRPGRPRAGIPRRKREIRL